MKEIVKIENLEKLKIVTLTPIMPFLKQFCSISPYFVVFAPRFESSCSNL